MEWIITFIRRNYFNFTILRITILIIIIVLFNIIILSIILYIRKYQNTIFFYSVAYEY